MNDTIANPEEAKLPRRAFLRHALRLAGLVGLGGLGLRLWGRGAACGDPGACTGCALNPLCGGGLPSSSGLLWQIDPDKCIQCGQCATACVLPISAVRCVHGYAMCGYCELCGGYFRPEATVLDTGAENHLCPTGAVKRTFVEDPYFEYAIERELCVGCGKCVKGCGAFGNGSLYLQVQQDICRRCNECAIAVVCPANAFVRVPHSRPYILRGEG